MNKTQNQTKSTSNQRGKNKLLNQYFLTQELLPVNLIQSLGRTQLTRNESIKYTNKHSESKFKNGFENMLNLQKFSQGIRASVISSTLDSSSSSSQLLFYACFCHFLLLFWNVRRVKHQRKPKALFLLCGRRQWRLSEGFLTSKNVPPLEQKSNLFFPSGRLSVTTRCSILLSKRSHFMGSGTSLGGSQLS